jgi:hypothetical protein
MEEINPALDMRLRYPATVDVERSPTALPISRMVGPKPFSAENAWINSRI